MVDTLLIDDTPYETAITKKFANRKPWAPDDPNLISARIPGAILAIHVAVGDPVEIGTKLLVLEAMKMQNDVVSRTAGKVRAIHVAVGSVVPKGTLLVEIEG
jgi:biotin carboxyl carrier protein